MRFIFALALAWPGSRAAVSDMPEAAEQPSIVPPSKLLGAHKVANATSFGVDKSFPIHHAASLKKGSLEDTRYGAFMKGCADKYNRHSCESSERSRLSLNFVQPPTQQNYTELGFAHVRAPDGAFGPLTKFFQDHSQHMATEQWPSGNT